MADLVELADLHRVEQLGPGEIDAFGDRCPLKARFFAPGEGVTDPRTTERFALLDGFVQRLRLVGRRIGGAQRIMNLGIGDVFNCRLAGNVENEDILGSMEFACKVAGAQVVLAMRNLETGAVEFFG